MDGGIEYDIVLRIGFLNADLVTAYYIILCIVNILNKYYFSIQYEYITLIITDGTRGWIFAAI